MNTALQVIPKQGSMTRISEIFLEGRSSQKAFYKCECGTVKKMFVQNVVRRNQSCGCKKREKVSIARTDHGDNKRGKRTTEYKTWIGMRSRCLNSKHKNFLRYGGRGG